MKRGMLLFLIVLVYFSPCFGFELIVRGDSQPGFGNEDYRMTRAIINDAIEYAESHCNDLRGIIMTGDYVRSGKNSDEWEEWLAAHEVALKYPVYPCIGNHDDEHSDCPWWSLSCEIESFTETNYYQVFKMWRWWSVDIEELHLVALDSNLEGFNSTTLEGDLLEEFQYDWFVKDLEENSDKPTIVFWHEPAYGSYTWFGKGHGSNGFMRERYVSVCEEYGVKMVFYGHNHWYERVTVNEIQHVTTGGGGGTLLPTSPFFWDRVEGSEVNITAFHWLVMNVNEDSIKVEVIHHFTHWLLDSFEIEI